MSSNQNDALIQVITKDEIDDVVKDMATDKAPRPNGIIFFSYIFGI